MGTICCNYPGNPPGCNKGNCCVVPVVDVLTKKVKCPNEAPDY
jgi:hypothetical protein